MQHFHQMLLKDDKQHTHVYIFAKEEEKDLKLTGCQFMSSFIWNKIITINETIFSTLNWSRALHSRAS